MNLENNFNASKAAEYLGVSRGTFYNMILRHKIKPSGQHGNMKLYDKRDLIAIKHDAYDHRIHCKPPRPKRKYQD